MLEDNRHEIIKDDDQLSQESAWNLLFDAVLQRDNQSDIDFETATPSTIKHFETQQSSALNAMQILADYLHLDV